MGKINLINLGKFSVMMQTKNDCYNDGRYLGTDQYPVKGIMIHSTATPGVTAKKFAKLWNGSYRHGEVKQQVAVNAFVDDEEIIQTMPWNKRTWHSGGSANNTHISIEMCEPLETTFIIKPTLKVGEWCDSYAVKSVQSVLSKIGYYQGKIDGDYGPMSQDAIKEYQIDHKLSPDGIVGPMTWGYIINEGLGCEYNPNNKETKEYFDKVYNNAVKLSAYLCKLYDLDPSSIICHSEGYEMGIASNHYDVMHWFPYHGKDMDDFRRDVDSELNPPVSVNLIVNEFKKPEKPTLISKLSSLFEGFIKRF